MDKKRVKKLLVTALKALDAALGELEKLDEAITALEVEVNRFEEETK